MKGRRAAPPPPPLPMAAARFDAVENARSIFIKELSLYPCIRINKEAQCQ